MDTVSKEQMWIEIINGPNLARLGQREPALYGRETMEDCLERLHAAYNERLRLTYFQSHHEGGLIERLYALQDQRVSGIVLNAGAYTHTSLALADALRSRRSISGSPYARAPSSPPPVVGSSRDSAWMSTASASRPSSRYLALEPKTKAQPQQTHILY